ncbi:sulfotransferase family cytosolic 2B member 1-like isoform X1, partial [Clarias magur]
MLEEFTDCFLEGNVMFGKWTDHVKSWRNADLGDRIFCITYEEMLQLSEEALKQVIEQSQFKAMKQRKMSNSSLVSQKIPDNMRPPHLRK